jgi:hypothetical protein
MRLWEPRTKALRRGDGLVRGAFSWRSWLTPVVVAAHSLPQHLEDNSR